MLKVLLSVGALQVAVMAVMLVRTKVLAVVLGPEQFGLMATLDRLVAVFAQTASLSIPFAALRYLSPLWHTDRAEYYELFGRMVRLLAALVVAAMALGLALSWKAPGVLGVDIAHDRLLWALAFAGLPAAALVPFLQNTIASSFAHNRAMLFALLNAAVLATASVVGTITWGLRGLYGTYAILGGGFVLIVLRSIWGRPRQAGTVTKKEQSRRTLISRLAGLLPALVWRFCLLLLPTSFLAPAAAYVLFYLVFSRHGDQAAGYMQAAIGISLAVRGVLGASNRVFLTPLVNRSGHLSERIERANSFLKVLMLLVGVTVPPLILLSETAVWLLYSEEFLPGAPFVAVFVIAEVLALTVGSYQAVLIAMEHVVYHVAQSIAAQLAMLAVAVVMIPKLGISGAAIATLTAPAVLILATLAYLSYRHDVRPPARLLVLGLYVFGVLVAAGFLSARLPAVGMNALALKSLFFVTATGVLALFLNRQDWSNLRRMAARSGWGD